MRYQKILLSGIAATSLMTLFSYALTHYTKQDYREPELLADMEEKVLPDPLQPYASSFGWLTHYTVGFGFSWLYEMFFKNNFCINKPVKGVLFGSMAGVAGIAAWKSAHTLHPDPPNINHKNFYLQLIMAHIVFGLVTVGLQGGPHKSNIVSIIKKVKARRQGIS